MLTFPLYPSYPLLPVLQTAHFTYTDILPYTYMCVRRYAFVLGIPSSPLSLSPVVGYPFLLYVCLYEGHGAGDNVITDGKCRI